MRRPRDAARQNLGRNAIAGLAALRKLIHKWTSARRPALPSLALGRATHASDTNGHGRLDSYSIAQSSGSFSDFLRGCHFLSFNFSVRAIVTSLWVGCCTIFSPKLKCIMACSRFTQLFRQGWSLASRSLTSSMLHSIVDTDTRACPRRSRPNTA